MPPERAYGIWAGACDETHVHTAKLDEAGLRPQPAEADISPKGADSGFDPNRTTAGSKSRSAASP